MSLSHSQGPPRNSAWTRTNSWNALVEPWHKGHFSSDDTLGFPSGASSLSLLRYMGARPRPSEVPALCLELFGKKMLLAKKVFLLRLLEYTQHLSYVFFFFFVLLLERFSVVGWAKWLYFTFILHFKGVATSTSKKDLHSHQ